MCLDRRGVDRNGGEGGRLARGKEAKECNGKGGERGGRCPGGVGGGLTEACGEGTEALPWTARNAPHVPCVRLCVWVAYGDMGGGIGVVPGRAQLTSAARPQ